jgi:hypothetical protein
MAEKDATIAEILTEDAEKEAEELHEHHMHQSQNKKETKTPPAY